ncbi:MAG: GNAT family N-acetyltransferase [Bacteroidia bacterium]|nr:GNAT family N-acetyltransferase [Bacteroidia bacterium]
METTWTDVAQAIAAISGAVISFLGFFFIVRQIQQTNKNLKQNNHIAIYSLNTDIYKFFAENSELRPYFHENKAPKKKVLNKILSVSEMFADFFEFILIEKKSLSKDIQQPWENYMAHIFINSPGFRHFIRSNKENYCQELLLFFAKVAPEFQGNDLSCQFLKNDAEFLEIDKIYQECFAESSVPTQIQKEWWKNQPKGIIVLKNGPQIIGGMSFWNISKFIFNQFREGLIFERDIETKEMPQENAEYIYLSDIGIIDDFKGRKFSSLLMKEFIKELEERLKRVKAIHLLALGYSLEGEKLLGKLGFHKILDGTESKDGSPLFHLQVDKKEGLKNMKVEFL